MRKKLYDHKTSHSHKLAESICQKKAESTLDGRFFRAQQELLSTTEKVFRRAYYIAKCNRPFTDHPGLIDLQRINGLNMGRILHTNVLCTDIVHFIAEEMIKALMVSIRCTRPKVSILIDESTTVIKKSCLVVYMQAALQNSDPLTFFLSWSRLQQIASLMHFSTASWTMD